MLKRTRCQHCGGWMYPDYDGFTCLICGRQTSPLGYKAIGEIAFEEPSILPPHRNRANRRHRFNREQNL